MPESKPFRMAARVKSFLQALSGLKTMLRTQHNAWIHLAATFLVIGAGVGLRLTPFEWVAIILAIVLVWTAEALNTALEFLCDVVSPEFHPLVGMAKDVAAGAVLVSALGAAAIGTIVFLQHS